MTLQHDFQDAVRVHLRPIVEKAGFEPTDWRADSVEFQSSDCRLVISFDHYSFELELHVLWTVSPSEVFALSELIHLANRDAYRQYRNFTAVDSQEIDSGVANISNIFLQLMGAGLIFNRHTFRALSVQKKTIAKDMEIESRCRKARSDAASAWIRKDYSAVEKSLESIRPYLTDLEIKRLGYIRERNP